MSATRDASTQAYVADQGIEVRVTRTGPPFWPTWWGDLAANGRLFAPRFASGRTRGATIEACRRRWVAQEGGDAGDGAAHRRETVTERWARRADTEAERT